MKTLAAKIAELELELEALDLDLDRPNAMRPRIIARRTSILRSLKWYRARQHGPAAARAKELTRTNEGV